MNPKEWRNELGEIVRDYFRSPELGQFYETPVTLERAQLYLSQLGIYVRRRRDYWPQVAANCPVFVVKQRIMSHEYEELVEDEYSDHGHLDLIFRQAREVGLSEQEVVDAEPLPTTRAAVFGWFWIARTRPWQEGARRVHHRGVDQRRPPAGRLGRWQLRPAVRKLEQGP